LADGGGPLSALVSRGAVGTHPPHLASARGPHHFLGLRGTSVTVVLVRYSCEKFWAFPVPVWRMRKCPAKRVRQPIENKIGRVVRKRLGGFAEHFTEVTEIEGEVIEG
jgi:hypothetical protein